MLYTRMHHLCWDAMCPCEGRSELMVGSLAKLSYKWRALFPPWLELQEPRVVFDQMGSCESARPTLLLH